MLARFPNKPGRTAAEAEAWLAARGVLVRHVANYCLPDCLRISIGLEDHNRVVVERLREFLAA